MLCADECNYSHKNILLIHHVNIQVPQKSVAEYVEFYRLLGFVELNLPPTMASRATWLRVGQAELHLEYSEPGVELSVNGGHFAVVVADYEAVVARLSEHGFSVEPRQEHWGTPRSFVRDPGGNQVELTAPPEQ